jgi:hypothetical protein
MQARWGLGAKSRLCKKEPTPQKKKARWEEPGFLNLALATLRCRGRARNLDWEEDRFRG